VGDIDENFMAFQACVEAVDGRKMGTLHMDSGGGFMTCTFIDHYVKEGIQRHLTALFSPEQNKLVETRNQTILGVAHSMLKAMELPG
jgi:hypothetical protein